MASGQFQLKPYEAKEGSNLYGHNLGIPFAELFWVCRLFFGKFYVLLPLCSFQYLQVKSILAVAHWF